MKTIYLSFLMMLPVMSFADSDGDLSLSVFGHIKSHCEINFNRGDKLDFSNDIQKSVLFEIQCNQPMGMSLYSQNGGLSLQQSKIPVVVQYQLNIDVASIGINRTLQSKDLSSPKLIESSSVIPFTTEGVMRVTLEENLHYAGLYEDIIEIDVYPSIHGVDP